MAQLVYIAIFGVLGVFCRYGTNWITTRAFPSELPLATFGINIVGAFLIGVFFVIGVERSALSPELRVGIMVGFLGGMTTFSTYCLESLALIQQGRLWTAALYFGLSPLCGIIAAFCGILLGRKWMA